jgi:hypothetical protein
MFELHLRDDLLNACASVSYTQSVGRDFCRVEKLARKWNAARPMDSCYTAERKMTSMLDKKQRHSSANEI